MELIKQHNAYKAKRLRWHSWSEYSHTQPKYKYLAIFKGENVGY